MYKAHSTRAAVALAANMKQVPIDTILSAAGWSNMNTFAQLLYSSPCKTPLKILVKNFQKMGMTFDC